MAIYIRINSYTRRHIEVKKAKKTKNRNIEVRTQEGKKDIKTHQCQDPTSRKRETN